jgi:hypothetical protein
MSTPRKPESYVTATATDTRPMNPLWEGDLSMYKTLLLLVLLVGLPTASAFAQPTVLPTAAPTISLVGADDDDTQANIAYHPGFDRYYGANAGSETDNSYVWSNTGANIQTTPNGVNSRGLFYNRITKNIEHVTFAADLGGPAEGYRDGTLTLDGLWSGTAGEIIRDTLPGLGSSLPIVAYDSLRNRIYSRTESNIVTIVSPDTGMSLGTIALDLDGGAINDFVVGFDIDADTFVTYDNVGNRALVNDIDGNFLGASTVPDQPYATRFSVGYANGQIFLLNTATDEYEGFEVLTVPEPATTASLVAVAVILGLSRRRSQRTA